MKSDINLSLDTRRILGSFFWIVGALLMFSVALDGYKSDIENNN